MKWDPAWLIEAKWCIYESLNWVIIGSDNGLSPVQRQAMIWTNAGILLIGPLGTNFSEILIGIQTFSFKKLHLKNVVCKVTSILSRPQCVKGWTQWIKIHRYDSVQSCYDIVNFIQILSKMGKLWDVSGVFESSPPWCRIYASVNWFGISSDNGLSPGWRQAMA